LEQFKADPTPRVKLQELYQKAIANADERETLVMLYDVEIGTLEARIKDLKQAFKGEFHWRERVNFFSGARLWISREIAAMELDLREMKKERDEVFRLIPRANVLVRTFHAIREQMNQGRDKLVRSATDALTDKPANSSEAKFLDPMNPASPYYNLPIGSGRDEDER
jgi:nucleoside-triphosphatase THEP1